MDFILGIAAFAGFMALFSTVASALAEAVHKAFLARSRGLLKMMRTLHAIHIAGDGEARLLEAKEGVSAQSRLSDDSKTFADIMVAIPTRQPKGLRHMETLPTFIRPCVRPWDRKFQSFTQTQFVEQLGQTKFGRELAKKERDVIERALGILIYQFERLGDAQTHVFKMRAKFIAAIMAFVLCAALNLDAPAMFRHLIHDAEASRAVIGTLVETQAVDEEGAENGASDADAAFPATALEDRLFQLRGELQEIAAQAKEAQRDAAPALDVAQDAAQDAADASAGLGDGAPPAIAYALNQIDQITTELSADVAAAQSMFAAANVQIDALRSAGVPIGRNYYPYCENPVLDPRCADLKPVSELTIKEMFGTRLSAGGYVDFLFWLLAIGGSAALLGLGASFWFGLFARTAQAANLSSGGGRAKDAEEGKAKAAKGPSRSAVLRPEGEAELSTLADVLLINAGVLKTTRLDAELRSEDASADDVDEGGGAFAAGSASKVKAIGPAAGASSQSGASPGRKGAKARARPIRRLISKGKSA